jgi:hypothetical protein
MFAVFSFEVVYNFFFKKTTVVTHDGCMGRCLPPSVSHDGCMGPLPADFPWATAVGLTAVAHSG